GIGYTTTIIYFDPARGGGGDAGGFGGDPDFFAAPNPDSYVGDHSAMRLTDDQDVTIKMDYLLPTDYLLASWQVDTLIIPGGTGDMRIGITTDYGKICAGEQYDTHDEVQVAGEVAVTSGEIECVTLTNSITAAAALDLVGMSFTRYGSHIDDTVDADCYFIGVVIRRP
ncbi:unnamed protein product, partial [marine sediment metagenome]